MSLTLLSFLSVINRLFDIIRVNARYLLFVLPEVMMLLVPRETLRSWMIQYYESGLADGDYPVIFLNQQGNAREETAVETETEGWTDESDAANDHKAFEALKSVFMVSVHGKCSW